eukprot:scaffold20724_cov60-Phaeocystis_antarctica.AAC.1
MAGVFRETRAIGEDRGARPRATDKQLVGVGQGVRALPSRKGGHAIGARCGSGGGAAWGGAGASDMHG